MPINKYQTSIEKIADDSVVKSSNCSYKGPGFGF